MLLLEQFEHLTLHPKNAARLKALVLQLAVQGKLTENWRRQNPAVEPAAELLERIKAEKAQLVKEKKIKKEKPLEQISADEVPYILPETWTWTKLGDYLKVITDGSHFSPATQDIGYPYITVRDLDWSGNIDFESCKKINDTAYQELLKSGCKPEVNDVLFSKDGTVGKTAVISEEREFVVLSSLAILRPIVSSIDSQFLRLLLTAPSILSQAIEKKTGSALKRIVLAKIKHLIIPLPTLAEQEAIVARVEELMQKIEELEKQTAERIQLKQHLGAAALHALTAAADEELEQNWLFLKQHFQTIFDEAANVKKLRETILQLAVQGKLTCAWRRQNPATEPASELLKRIQADKAQLVKEKKIKKEKPLEPVSEDEVTYNLPKGWAWCRFGDLILDIEAGTSPSCEPQEAGIDEWGVIKMSAVSWGEFLERENKKLPSSIPPFEDKEIVAGDFIMTRANTAELIARSVIVGDLVRSKLLLNDKTLRVRFQSATVKAYCNLFNNCSVARAYYKEVASGTSDSMKNIGREQIKGLLIPLPSEAEQQAIFNKVDQLMKLCDELEQQLQQSKQVAEALMQAVVQEAFQVQEEEVV